VIKKLMTVLLTGIICLVGLTPALATYNSWNLSDYEELTGKRIEKFNEAPILRTKVAAGILPPVEERLPEEPLIVQPLEEIGQYGGTIRCAATNPTSYGNDIWSARNQHFFTLYPDLKTIAPQIIKNFEFSKDLKALTIYLRKGMKWSDGVPFTADDIMFWYKDIILNDELTPVKPKAWSPGGKLVEVEKINDYTVRFQFAAPYPVIMDKLAMGNDPFAPKHYLKNWHIKYNPRANETAKKEGYDNWWQCFEFHQETSDKQEDPNLPTLNPWVYTKTDAHGNKYYQRNPYYWKVDTSGNQLPYIDTQVRVLVENNEIKTLKLIAGELDYGMQHLQLRDYPLFKKGEKKGGYRCLLWKGVRGCQFIYAFNLTCKEPVLRKIFNDIRFRQAMSLAINREEINKVLYYGKGVPRQATTPSMTSFYEDWMGKYYAEYDPERANKLLDEMGLKWDKDHKYRLRPDGKVLAITIEDACRNEKMDEMIKEYWEKVGVKVAIKPEARNFYASRGVANELEASTWFYDMTSEFCMHRRPLMFRPPWGLDTAPRSGITWKMWYNTDGKTGEEPPEVIKKLFKLCDEFQTTVTGTEEYMRLGKEILTIHAKNLFLIGTVGMVPAPVIVKNNLRNIPEKGVMGDSDYNYFLPYQGDQWFFKK